MGETLPQVGRSRPDLLRPSVARWEGDTLVIETTGIKQNVTFRWTPHSEGMKITERLRLLAPDILQQRDHGRGRIPRAAVDLFLHLPPHAGYKLLEYVCEDNRDYVDEHGNVTLRIDE